MYWIVAIATDTCTCLPYTPVYTLLSFSMSHQKKKKKAVGLGVRSHNASFFFFDTHSLQGFYFYYFYACLDFTMIILQALWPHLPAYVNGNTQNMADILPSHAYLLPSIRIISHVTSDIRPSRFSGKSR